MAKLFTNEDTWFGGFYELAMEFASEPRERLERALITLWESPNVRGCYLQSDIEPAQQTAISPSWSLVEGHGHLRGVARLPDGKEVACGTCAVKEEGGPTWLVFYLPMGALEALYPTPDSFDGPSPEGRQLEEWLAELGQRVFACADYSLGLIGHEVSGTVYSQEVHQTGVPAERAMGYLWPDKGRLRWYPVNQWFLEEKSAS